MYNNRTILNLTKIIFLRTSEYYFLSEFIKTKYICVCIDTAIRPSDYFRYLIKEYVGNSYLKQKYLI